MNRSGASQLATAARQVQAAMRRVEKNATAHADCQHGAVLVEDGLATCLICDSHGPWHDHPTHGHFTNGDPA